MSIYRNRRRLEIKEIGDITVLSFIKNEIGKSEISKICEEIINLATGLNKKRIILDFKNIGHLSIAYMEKIIRLSHKIKDAGCEFVICNINTDNYSLFDIIKLNRILKIAKGEKEALASFQ